MEMSCHKDLIFINLKEELLYTLASSTHVVLKVISTEAGQFV